MSIHWIALALAIIISMAGQTLLKAGAAAESFFAQLFDWRTMVGLCLYGGSAILYIVALRRIPMSVALPCTAVSYIAATALGYFIFGEALGLMKIGALALIASGVVLLAFSA